MRRVASVLICHICAINEIYTQGGRHGGHEWTPSDASFNAKSRMDFSGRKEEEKESAPLASAAVLKST